MKFKSLVLISPAACQLSENFRTQFLFYASGLFCTTTRSRTHREGMMLQIAATMLFPMFDKQRAEMHRGGNRREG